MKRAFSVLFALLIVILSVASAGAVSFNCPVEPVSDAVYMEELNTGIVVYENNADETVYPASTTKIMTFIVVAESVPDIDTTRIEISSESLSTLDPESSVMGLESHIGESYTVRDLLYGLMLPSGNDAALVLADYIGQGIDGFVDLMNRKAAQLGCNNTHFTSPHGLHDTQHYTTAREMAVITKYAMQRPEFMEICNTTSYTPTGFSEPIKTTNYLIDESQKDGYYYYPYANGIKTGFTDQAGRCLVSTAEKDGYTYLCIALGADYSYEEDINYAMLDSAQLYDWAFDTLTLQTVYHSDDVLQSIPVEEAYGDKLLYLVPGEDVKALLPQGYDSSLISSKVECPDVATAPVEKGQVFGKLTVYYDDAVIGTTDIVAAESVEKMGFVSYVLHRIGSAIEHHFVIFIIVLIVFVIIIILIVAAVRRKKAQKARRRRRFK